MVEVEFDSAEAAAGFWPPAWFGRELTGDPAWANQSLASVGLPEKRLEHRLRPGEDPGTGVCRVITTRAAEAAAAARAAGEAADPASQVHEARKCLKKVRSALRMLRGVIDDGQRQTANQTCREASRRLAGARDAEVKLATLETIAAEGTAAELRRHFEREAEEHRAELTPQSLGDVARQIESVARDFRGRELPGAGEAIAGNVERSYRRGRKAMKKAAEAGRPEDFHRWRKRAKDLRYQLEILEPEVSASFADTRKQVEELADLLGDLHDLDVLAEDLERREPGSDDLGRLSALIAQARGAKARDCLEQGQKIYGAKSKRFARSLRKELGPAG